MNDSIRCIDPWREMMTRMICAEAMGGRYEGTTFNCIFNRHCMEMSIIFDIEYNYNPKYYYSSNLLRLFHGIIRIT
jgi:hypothetical protein